jgi:hypothetical protein
MTEIFNSHEIIYEGGKTTFLPSKSNSHWMVKLEYYIWPLIIAIVGSIVTYLNFNIPWYYYILPVISFVYFGFDIFLKFASNLIIATTYTLSENGLYCENKDEDCEEDEWSDTYELLDLNLIVIKFKGGYSVSMLVAGRDSKEEIFPLLASTSRDECIKIKYEIIDIIKAHLNKN